MNMSKTIFISHPYASDPKGNLDRARKIIDKLAKDNPQNLYICPLLTFSYVEQETEDLRQLIMDYCYKLVDYANEFYIYGNSEGCLQELQYAKDRDKVIVDMTGLNYREPK